MSYAYRMNQKLSWFKQDLANRIGFLGAIRDARHNRMFKETREAIQKDGIPCCNDFISRMRAEGIESFLVFGSLLGIVREGKFLEHDEDIDIAVIVGESFSWKQVDKIADGCGLKLMHSFSLEGETTEKSYTNGSFKIDVFGLYMNAEDALTAYLYTLVKNKIFDNPFDRVVLSLQIPLPNGFVGIEAKGHTFLVPTNYEDYLSAMYGSNWRIPDPSWSMGKGWNEVEGKIGRKHMPND